MFTPNRRSLLLKASLTLLALMIPILWSGWVIWQGAVLPAAAAPLRQVPIYTPTPGPDGRIIYVVKANDTLLSISLLTGVPVDELRGLNNLTSDTIFEGQHLLLGLSGPADVTLTPGPTPTPTEAVPTPTPQSGTGNLCILLFNDLNGDSLRQEEEPSIPEGAISLNNRVGSVSETTPTISGTDPQCFNDLEEGEYSVSVALPAGYNPTTTSSFVLTLGAGDEAYLDFGAQANSETLAEAPLIPEGDDRSPLLGIIGGLFLALGVAVAFVASRMIRR